MLGLKLIHVSKRGPLVKESTEAYFIGKINQHLLKLPLKSNGSLAKLNLLCKEVTDHQQTQCWHPHRWQITFYLTNIYNLMWFVNNGKKTGEAAADDLKFEIIKSPQSGVTLCFQFISAASDGASDAATTFASHVKTVSAKP